MKAAIIRILRIGNVDDQESATFLAVQIYLYLSRPRDRDLFYSREFRLLITTKSSQRFRTGKCIAEKIQGRGEVFPRSPQSLNISEVSRCCPRYPTCRPHDINVQMHVLKCTSELRAARQGRRSQALRVQPLPNEDLASRSVQSLDLDYCFW